MSDFNRFNQDYYDEQTRVHRLKVKRTRRGRFLFTALCMLVVFSSLSYALFVYADNFWAFVADRYFDSRINPASASGLPQNEKHRLNILLVGVDQRKNESSRSDTLMVATLDLKDKTVQVISIPRDTRVRIDGLANRTKINHAHANGGVALTRKTVEELLGIPIHNCVETNFKGFENIIDILGGVNIDVEKRMYYPPEKINLYKGNRRLDGQDALAYVRYRSDGKGDLPRIERQHKFLGALADEVLQPKTILRLPQMAGELHNNVNTDMSIKDLMVLMGEFKNISSRNITFYNLPGKPEYINGASYFVVDEGQLGALIESITNGPSPKTNPLPENNDLNT